ncbi:MAG: hydroxymethylglutaryl-CoA lyase [Spirochaetes bacterium]|nr:hydroxymethylglutaryl-CoA lyase [Spirochaetota bacterium]
MYKIDIDKVKIFEVCPRDGLQNIKEFIKTDQKIRLVNMLTDAGCEAIEVTSFVHPKWVPQLADAAEVLSSITMNPNIVYNALIPNIKGLERAIASGLKEVVTIMSASEAHNKKNLNMSIADSLAQMKEINDVARVHGIRVRSYIATSFGCPMQGKIAPEYVAEIAAELERIGSYEISLGDTTGMSEPVLSYKVVKAVKRTLSKSRLAVHFHRSGGIEFANILASLQAGVDVIDSAVGGLGGCPYAPGAKGNIATEVLVEMLDRMGIETGIDLAKIQKAAEYAKSLDPYASCVEGGSDE